MINLANLPKPTASSRGLLNLLNGLQRNFALPVYPDLADSPEQHTMFLSVHSAERPGQCYHSAHMQCNLGDATVFATPEWLEHLCDILLSGWRDEAREALSWDVCVAYVLSRIAKLSGFDVGPLSFSDVKVNVDIPDSPGASVVRANVRSGDRAYPIAMQVHNCALTEASLLLGEAPDAAVEAKATDLALVDPGFVYTMRCRQQFFDLAMLWDVKIGSIITFDHVEAGGCKVICTLPGIVRFEAQFGPDKQLTVHKFIEEGQYMASEFPQNDLAPVDDFDKSPVQRQPLSIQAQTDPVEMPTASLPDDDGEVAQRIDEMSVVKDIGRLPVSVEFCFPSQNMTLRELSTLGTGSSFKLDCVLEERLIVRVNGRAVGGGHLVDLDGILGLKVSDWSLSPAVHEDTRGRELD